MGDSEGITEEVKVRSELCYYQKVVISKPIMSVQSLEQKLRDITNDLQSLENKHNQERNERDKLQQKIADLTNELRKVNDKILQLENEQSKLQTKRQEVDRELKRARQDEQ
jgi:septal ring factor EnvC (AmiA/AmiB activator)